MNIDNYNAYKERGMSGKKHSAESIEKMKQSHSGQIPWNKGKKMPDGMREKMQILKKGNKNRLGKYHTEATRLKISLNRQGKSTGKNHHAWKGGSLTRMIKNNQIRKQRLLSAGGYHTEAQWELLKKQYNFTCPACFDDKKSLTKDHIIPVSKGGSNNIENIQPLCKRCNSKKHTRIINYKLNEKL